MYNFLTIPIPKPNTLVQTYVGNKLRQAELLRKWAFSIEEEIKSYFDRILKNVPTKGVLQRHTKVTSLDLIPRVNAEYYSEDYRQVERALKSEFKSLVEVKDIAPVNKDKERPSSDCVYYEIGDIDPAKGKVDGGTFYALGEAPNNAQRRFDFGDIAISTRRPNRGAIAVIEDSEENSFYSVFLVRLKPQSIGFAYWLKEYLRHEVGKALLLQRCTWTTYPVISEDDISSIPVPKLEDDWDFVGDLASTKNKLYDQSVKLTQTAKLLVESLIEGKITENEIIAAQKALENDDNTKDRAILSKLTDKGYAVKDANPLFTDLDRLYELLEEAQQDKDQD